MDKEPTTILRILLAKCQKSSNPAELLLSQNGSEQNDIEKVNFATLATQTTNSAPTIMISPTQQPTIFDQNFMLDQDEYNSSDCISQSNRRNGNDLLNNIYEPNNQDDLHFKKQLFSNDSSDDNFEPKLKKKIKPNLEECRFRIRTESTYSTSLEEDQKNNLEQGNSKQNYFSEQDCFKNLFSSSPEFSPERNEESNQSCFNKFFNESHQFLTPLLTAKNDNKKLFNDFNIDDDNGINQELQNILKENQGSMKKNCIIQNDKQSIIIKCSFKHEWYTNLRNLRSNWCPQCQSLLEDCKQTAKNFDFEILNQKYNANLQFQCSYGHQWIHSHKNWEKKRCQKCIEYCKQIKKKKLQEEENIRQENLKRKQEVLFEEAKQKMINEDYNTKINNSYSSKIIKIYKQLETDIENHIAQKYSDEIQNSDQKNKIIATLKMIFLPEKQLKMFMSVLSNESKKTEFRKWAKLLHPDKNKHTLSNQAFQKLNSIYNSSISGEYD